MENKYLRVDREEDGRLIRVQWIQDGVCLSKLPKPLRGKKAEKAIDYAKAEGIKVIEVALVR